MLLSEEKIKKLEEMDTDYTRLIIKFQKYLIFRHTLREGVKEKIFQSVSLKDEKDFNLVFSETEEETKNQYNLPQTPFMKDFSKREDENYYYSGKKMEERQRFDYVSEELKEKIKSASNITVWINVKAVSSYPLWNTKMRRKMKAVLTTVNALEINKLKDSELASVIEKTSMEPVKEEKRYELDYVISILKFLHKEKKNYTVFYIGKRESLSDEEIFFINEIEKLVEALEREKDRYEYIYGTVCDDLDQFFSTFGFCDFRENQCFSQRHKDIFKNHYPVPKRNGCCFNVYRKCKHLQKDGSCDTKCLACKLYTCPFLGRMKIGIMVSEVLLLRSFLNREQKRDVIYQFFTPQETILKNVEKHRNK